MDIEFDSEVAVESQMPIKAIGFGVGICSADEFSRKGEDWDLLVGDFELQPSRRNFDTALFSDELELEMGKVQVKHKLLCPWDKSCLVRKTDFRQHKIARAIPIDGGRKFLVGVVRWQM